MMWAASGSAARHATAAAVCGAAAWLGWQAIASTAAMTLAARDPAAALGWDATSPAALVRLAERHLAVGAADADLTAASDSAKRALAASPLEARSLRLLGLVANLEGDEGRAARLMTTAGERSLRDPPTQLWLFASRLGSGDVAGALANADHLLRTEPQLANLLLPTLAALAGEPAMRADVIALLEREPPWRRWFLTELARGDRPAVTFAVLSGLGSGPSPPSEGELAPYLERLVGDGRYELAHLTWIHFVPEAAEAGLDYVTSGGFERPLAAAPFDWGIARTTGASTAIVATGDPDRGMAARVVFANARVAYRNLVQLMVLPPGSYRLSALTRANDLVNERGLAWRVRCAEGDKQLIAETPLVRGTTGWRRIEATFNVPSGGCRGQWLSLELAVRVAVEQQARGEVWFDDVTITRLAGDPAAG